MYHSKYLVNRQMITDPSQIKKSLSQYLSSDGKPMQNFFYRLEWYRIGISIPMDVYSEKMPTFQLRPECQLTQSELLDNLPVETDEINFKIFVVPYKNPSKNENLELSFINSWFQKKLKKSAKVIYSELGPNNRIYYKNNPDLSKLNQVQSYTLRGKLKCLDVKQLDTLRRKPFGYYDDLGCGLLMLG